MKAVALACWMAADLALAVGCGSAAAPLAAEVADTADGQGDAVSADAAQPDTTNETQDIASKAPPICPVATAPVACYHQCQPAPDALAPALPVPASCSDDYSGLTWDTADGKPSQPPTLQVEVGAADPDTGAFVPYKNGQWAPIVQGVQGGVHVWAAVRVALPGASGSKQVLEIAGHSLIDCQVVGVELLGTGKALTHLDVGSAGLWTNATALVPGVPVAFVQPTGGPYCGKWLRLVAEVRHPASGAWGTASALLRLWQADNLTPPKP